MKKGFHFVFWFSVFSLLFVSTAFATSTGLPWEEPFNKLVDSLAGPVVRAIAIIAIIGAGFAFMLTEGGSVLRRIAAVIIGISIATAAANFYGDFFGGAQGFVIV